MTDVSEVDITRKLDPFPVDVQSKTIGREAGCEYGYVLVADDEPVARAVIAHVVQDLNLSERLASDGLEALKMIQTSLPSLVILDLLMPNMDGFGVLARLRATRAGREIPVIVITAHDRHQVDMLKLPGVTDVLQKGEFTIPDIRRLITHTLGLDGVGPSDSVVNQPGLSLNGTR